METNIVVVSLPMHDMCTFCLKVGAVKNMFLSYGDDNNKEVYSEMLKNCYLIDIAMLELSDKKPLICMSCINKLRAAVRFRRMVEESIKNLHSVQDIKIEQCDSLVGPNKASHGTDLDDNNDVDEDFAADEDVKKEKVEGFTGGPSDAYGDDDDDDDDNDADEDYVPDDEDIKSDIKQEDAKRGKKSSHLVLKYMKKQNFTETEIMLKSGLFPFKMKKNHMYTCAVCSDSYACLDELKNHVMDHNKKYIHRAFKKMVLSNLHSYYKCETCLRCKVCTTDVKNYEELKSHNANCSRLKGGNKWNRLPFKLEKDQLDCPVCQKTFLNYVNLNTHMNVHYPNYICESCGKAFASKARLRGHMRTHEVGEFPCKYCGTVFDRVTKRENHVSKEHKAGVRYACKRCKITLPSFYARQKHLAEVHDEELKRYKCKVCPQSYITPGHLSSHVRRDHLNERNHQCERCDLAFYTKNALKMHMIKHDGERIHVCNICQKSYQRKKTLKEHMRIHNNDKRFVCPICGRAFTQKCTLKGHLKVHDRKLDVELTVLETLHSI